MRRSPTARCSALVVGVTLAALFAAGCGASTKDKAGGNEERGNPVVLTMASAIRGGQGEGLQAFAGEVKRLSGGSLRIVFRDNWRAGDPAVEAGTVEDVKDGKVDLAWVGARVFDTLGVTDFQALVAPFLVASHDLQQRVFEDGIPEEMLAGIEELDLEGLGVLPGPMRALLGITRSFTKPADFAGRVVGIQDSEVARLTLEALGATVKPVPAQASLAGLDAYEQQLASIRGNEYHRVADSITAGVNFWPRPLVIFTSGERFQRLTGEQQDVLRQAAAAALPVALAASRQEDADAAADLCRQFTFAQPTAADRAALEAAVRPVLDRIAGDPVAGSFLMRIQTLRREMATSATPTGPTCSKAPATNTAAAGTSALDGIYEVTLARAEWIAALGLDATAVPQALGDLDLTLALRNGRFLLSSKEDRWSHFGHYSVEGDTLALRFAGVPERPGPSWDLKWSLYRDRLTLASATPDATGVAYWVGLRPWHRSDDPSPDDFAAPPVKTLPPDGVYRTTITVEEYLRLGASRQDAENNAHTFELRLRDGVAKLCPPGCSSDIDTLTYRLDGARIRFDWQDGFAFSGTWSLEGDELRFTNLASAFGTFDIEFWGGAPWRKIS